MKSDNLFDEFFEDQEMMGHNWSLDPDYYTGINYEAFDPIFDDTLDYITMLPEKGDR